MDSKERQAYWEQYIEYWNNKVAEANDQNSNDKDKTVSDSIIFRSFDMLEVIKDEKFLDFGCGSCRLYPYVKNKEINYYGVDIARSPLEFAINLYPELKESLKVTIEDVIPYEDNSFNKLICFGVFDACYQEKTISEIIRVLDLGGRALITGKNINYHLDDDMALVAEINARKKNHPNYFTNLNDLVRQLNEKNVNILQTNYFERRGDSTISKFKTEQPEYFYEYSIIIEKTENSKWDLFDKFSYEFSNTFNQINALQK